MQERRQHTRTSIPKILVRIETSEAFREDFMGDLSEGGIFVSCTQTVAMGSVVEIDLLPPGWRDPLSLKGEVVRVADAARGGRTGMAVRFQDLSPRSLERLAELLDEYSEEPLPEEEKDPWSEDSVWRDEIELLEIELDKRRRELQTKDKAANQSQKQVALLRAQLAETERERDALLEEKGALEADLEAAQQAFESGVDAKEIGLENRRLRTRLTHFEERSHSLAARVEKQQSEAEAADSRIEELCGERDRLQEQLTHVEGELAKAREREAREADRQDHEARLENERLEWERRAREAEAKLEAQAAELLVEAADGQGNAANDETPALRNRLARAKHRIEDLERKAMDALEELERVRERVRDLETELKEARSGAQEIVVREVPEEWQTREIESGSPPGSEAAEASENLESLFEVTAASQAGVKAGAADPGGDDAHEPPPEADPEGDGSDVEDDSQSPDRLIRQAQSILSELPPPEDAPAGDDEPKPKRKASRKKARQRRPALEADDFERRVRAGSPLMKTPRFARLEPVSRGDIQVSDWLKTTESFQELLKMSAGKMPEKELIDIVYLFYQRSLLELEDEDGS